MELTADDARKSQDPICALPGRYYTDPDLYELEKDKIFAKTWQFAGHISQLSRKGAYFSFRIADEELFCVRGKDEEIRAFYNVCQHRAHQVVQGEGVARLLVCPYHAWSYELDGRLKKAPNDDKVPGFDRSKICLTEVRVEEFNGFIFVNLDPDAKPMDDWYPGAREELRAYVPNIDDLAPALWTHAEEDCNWKVSVENYSECYHCKLNHPTFATGVVKPETYNIMPQGHCLRHTTVSANLDRMTYPIDPNANEHAGDYGSWFLWPTISFQVYPGNVLNTYHWEPTGVDTVTAWRGWHTPHGDALDHITQLAQQDYDTTVVEDIRLVNSVQKGLKSRGYVPGPLVLDPEFGVNSEHSIRAIHDWVRKAMG